MSDQDDKGWKGPIGYRAAGFIAAHAPAPIADRIVAAVDKAYPLELSNDPYDDEDGAW